MSLNFVRRTLTVGLFFMGTALAGSTASAIGGVTDGGGNVSRSTRADLEDLTLNFNVMIWDISDAKLRGDSLQITRQPLSPDLAVLTQTIFGKPYFTIPREFHTSMAALKFDIVDGPCLDKGQPRDASTAPTKGSRICVSASRLARFPRTVLRQVFLPLVFHEVAHQYGFNESEAQAFQRLAEIHLKYRSAFVEAWVARGLCGTLTKVPLTSAQKIELYGADLPPLNLAPREREAGLLQCATKSARASVALDSTDDNVQRTTISNDGFSAAELAVLNENNPLGKEGISFRSMIAALEKPGAQSYCPACEKFGADPAYVMMLGAKAALRFIDQQVGALQNQ